MSERKSQVLVIGGGYAGLMAAIRLAGKVKRQQVEVTLVNAVENFVERPRLHEAAAGKALKIRPLAGMLSGTGVNYLQGLVTHVDPERQAVTVQTGEGLGAVRYDSLIYTLGSTVDRDGVPGVREFAYTLAPAGPRSAEELRRKLSEVAERSGRVVVCGSGPTGIEAAAEIAEISPNLQVTVLTAGKFGDFRDDRVQDYMRKAMNRFGVKVVEEAAVSEVREGVVIANHSEAIPYDLCLWAGGFKASPLARAAGLAVNEWDQVLVDPFMRSISHPAVYAAGDSAFPVRQAGAPYRMSLFTALVMAAHAADNISRLLQGKPQKPLGFSTYGQGIALGRRDAVGFLTYPNDQRSGPLVTGRFGLWLRNFFLWFILFTLTLERRRPGFFFWPGGRRGKEGMDSTVYVQPSEKLLSQ